MSFILVQPNRMINLDQIVEIKYTPETSGFDEEENAPYSRVSELEITLTSVRVEKITGYDGDVQGAASESDTVWLRDKEADKVWAFFIDPSKKVDNTIERVIA